MLTCCQALQPENEHVMKIWLACNITFVGLMHIVPCIFILIERWLCYRCYRHRL
jgi:hypothetical protein